MNPGDQARVSVSVKVPPAAAFRIFTEEIDQWWLRGLRFRASGRAHGLLHIESHAGGALYERIGERVIQLGRVTVWEPPSRLVFEWRGTALRGEDKTEVEVLFEPSANGTLVTVTHRGWSKIAPDHPARHGQEVRAFLRSTGLWWGDLLTSLREHTEP